MHKIKNILSVNGMKRAYLIGGGTVCMTAAAHAESADPLGDLQNGIDGATGIGITVAGVAVTVFLIKMAMKFARKGS
ncbi:hypothetical protein [Ruficoccus sp. ZRK36]|uniref:hypothetical protein n=1 Tax=Ruficoccus sp. ZRK36 TaxID=2866311 RepID=UPI001C7319DD|nr:hypothetical protein [Ruficoccus sp. ZRK36]QYY35170.1 hypothetical protein K0V07_12795 [Ruficoccus sp. ZRK36]